MEPIPRGEVTALIAELRAGDQIAAERLVPLLYTELRRLAGRYLGRERANHTLQATALVNEAYLRMVDQPEAKWQDRAHFIGVAARLMRQILVDHARAHHAAKRGGEQPKLPLDEGEAGDQAVAGFNDDLAGIIDLEEALDRLEKLDARQARLVELRFYGGLGNEEIAEAMGISVATVKREWSLARAWLKREMTRRSP